MIEVTLADACDFEDVLYARALEALTIDDLSREFNNMLSAIAHQSLRSSIGWRMLRGSWPFGFANVHGPAFRIKKY
jgi:hypothetical protein